MAAYDALSSLARVLEQILYPDQQRDVVVDHEKEQIKRLHENIILLLTFLEQFPREASNLEARITTSANGAADIIDYHISDEILSENGKNFPSTESAGHQIVLYTGLKHHNWQILCRELHESIKEIDSILKEVMQIKSSRSRTDLRSNHSTGSSSSSSRLAPKGKGKDTMVGFQEDLMEIRARLYGETSKLQIIPIVGMGGIGKTTLARYAHDDPLIVHHFDFRAWVTVSQDYCAPKILLGLLHSIDPSIKEQHEVMSDEFYELLVERVYKYLKGRRYLIVMDDMWNTKVWDEVRRIFPEDFNGSRIIITTRELDVASYPDSSSRPHQMQLMDVDQSWRLLREKVFGQEDCPLELEKIGKLIAENCRGLPLAIVVIAGVLSKVNLIQDTWKDIARNVNKAVNTSDEQFLEILSLSYTHLPHRLRPCFLYMGGFPEDLEIKVSRLIKYWVAEGFLKSTGSKDLEEVAEEYLEELAKRSLILVIEKSSTGKIKAVKIHDLLRDLCLKKARDENFLHVVNEFSSSSRGGIHNSRRLSIGVPNDCAYEFSSSSRGGIHNSRRLSILRNTWRVEFSSSSRGGIHNSRRLSILRNTWLHNSRRLSILRLLRHGVPNDYALPTRTIFLYGQYLYGFSCKSFRLLRVMDAMGVQLKSYPIAISELFHLRYLALCFQYKGGSSSSKFEVPGSLSKLQNLQTLILVNYNLPLPLEIWRMPRLRHLILSSGLLPYPCDQNVLALENLLSLVGVACFTCSRSILEMIPNLRKLVIIYPSSNIYRIGWSRYCLKNLVHLRKLEKLKFYAQPYGQGSLAQNIAFPRTLKRLTLYRCGIYWKDMQNIVGSLPNLEVLKLKGHACHGSKWETTEGEFRRLKLLLIESAYLSHWITESDHFPTLERLVLYDCDKLREIPRGIGEIPTLQLIEVDLRNLSLVKSAKCIEEEQRSFGNDDLQVHLLKWPHWSRVDMMKFCSSGYREVESRAHFLRSPTSIEVNEEDDEQSVDGVWNEEDDGFGDGVLGS